MQHFLVGGAVRDQLLERPIHERDYVVVGATESDMINKGYTRVGKDFPVFLHPKTHEEYALARTERKKGHGYAGFECHASPDITLEQDLLRRDLTINAMAMDHLGNIIDPYNGQEDLNNRVFRHVSPAFAEDPLRVFRVARFMARYHAYGFHIAEETQQLMVQMCSEEELLAISAERIWQETAKALMEPHPLRYFQILSSVGGLKHWYSEWQSIDFEALTFSSFTHHESLVNLVLSQRFAALVYLINTATNDDLESRLLDLTQLQQRLKLPNNVASSASTMLRESQLWMSNESLTAKSILESFDRLDVWRNDDKIQSLEHTVLFLSPSFEARILTIKTCLIAAKSVDVQAIIRAGKQGFEIKRALVAQRLMQIEEKLAQQSLSR